LSIQTEMENYSQPLSSQVPSSQMSFGEKGFSQAEKEEIQNLLQAKLTKEKIAYRSGPGGRTKFDLRVSH
jgi:hypothetical protein